MKKLTKKGVGFETINAGMLQFISFVLVTVLVILLVSVTLSLSIVRGGEFNASDGGTWTSAYNATLNLQEAANLPPQFAQIIVIVVIIVGILAMLAFLGYGVYTRMER